MVTIYGIKNCDTMKKARHYLDNNGVAYTFHDYRTDGVPETDLESWIAELGTDALINRRGTTWRKLPDTLKESLTDKSAVRLMCENPAVIKRPLLDLGDRRILGFKSSEYDSLFT
ncbi:MAG: ArsC family reductase [OM182 bacterium MED-G24]|uniref:ArsC family reductase n=1 Tax=OM182 bacterium MED-G24 TaxID=1986255 RepID=A0A2A5WYA5_9GAMM|nr:MAG: ArsC family reductase [OM182 bacterium MED-G24]|tara:strand:+ start:71 stop:415 length:345 start_codon:yes stop_codon:yes gene_type:complete